jgi:hypothetical protein
MGSAGLGSALFEIFWPIAGEKQAFLAPFLIAK